MQGCHRHSRVSEGPKVTGKALKMPFSLEPSNPRCSESSPQQPTTFQSEVAIPRQYKCKAEIALRLVPFPLPLKNMKFGGPDGMSEVAFNSIQSRSFFQTRGQPVVKPQKNWGYSG